MQRAVKILAVTTGALAAPVLVFALGMVVLASFEIQTNPEASLGYVVAAILAAPPLVAALLAGTGLLIRARYTFIALVLTIIGSLIALLPALLLASMGLTMTWNLLG